MSTFTQVEADLAAVQKRVKMLTAAHPHLSEHGRRLNAGRIREAQAEVESLETLSEIYARDGGYYTDDGAFVPVT